MVWTVPITWVDGDPLTAAQLNTFVRDNMNETAPGKAVLASRMLTTRGHNAIGERQWARAYVGDTMDVDAQFPNIQEDQDENSVGPTVTVEHGGSMLILFSCRIRVTSGGGNANYGPAINGSLPSGSNVAVRSGKSSFTGCGSYTFVTEEPGLAEITMAYGLSNSSSTADYAQRWLTVIPF